MFRTSSLPIIRSFPLYCVVVMVTMLRVGRPRNLGLIPGGE